MDFMCRLLKASSVDCNEKIVSNQPLKLTYGKKEYILLSQKVLEWLQFPFLEMFSSNADVYQHMFCRPLQDIAV